VVDDDPELVDMLRITLEGKGFTVRCAYSGRELFARELGYGVYSRNLPDGKGA
jgi:DNA-binding response OmpR family regulator